MLATKIPPRMGPHHTPTLPIAVPNHATVAENIERHTGVGWGEGSICLSPPFRGRTRGTVRCSYGRGLPVHFGATISRATKKIFEF
jgi:hypothetical protein